ncbi:MAG: alpha/beta hydrolase [Lachnospiraceae bacterium]|nr:alpha/beta hydrolase [Lachnospiraceae bacterium]
MKRQKIWIRIALILTLLTAAAGFSFYLYTKDYYHAESHAVPAAEETGAYLVYGSRENTVGLIFYPGAKVEEAAYSPLLSELSDNGLCCVAVKMPCHLAVLRPDAAKQVMEDFPDVERWFIGGHSLGGAMAADFAASKGQNLCGLILLAAYPTKDLGGLPVLSVYGSEDGVLNREKYSAAIPLANSLTEHVIEGGNHAGFGDYGPQKGDGAARISSEQQWQMTAQFILDFMQITTAS